MLRRSALCVALVLVLANVQGQPDEAEMRARGAIAASHIADITESLSPSAQRMQYAQAAQDSQHKLPATRRLQQALPSPPPPNPLKLKDGSTCCPGKPNLTSRPAALPGDATMTYPANLNSRCQFTITGNNQTANGIASAAINCQTLDGTDVLMYMGSTMLKFSNNFVGVYALAPPANGPVLDPNSIFLVSAGSILIHDSLFDNIALGSGYGLLTITEGTSPSVIQNTRFSRITTCLNLTPTSAQTCFSPVVASQPTTYLQIVASNFSQNGCYNSNLCHSGSVYVTNQASMIFRDSTISGSTGTFGGGMMITDGANFKAINSTFISSQTPVLGGFGGAIWLTSCVPYYPAGITAVTGFGVVDACLISGNYAAGSGGGMTISDCPNTYINATIFNGNTAFLVGGGLSIRGADSTNTTIANSFFLSNTVANFFGADISEEPCATNLYTITNTVFFGSFSPITLGTTGCAPNLALGVGNVVNGVITAVQSTVYTTLVTTIPGLLALTGK